MYYYKCNDCSCLVTSTGEVKGCPECGGTLSFTKPYCVNYFISDFLVKNHCKGYEWLSSSERYDGLTSASSNIALQAESVKNSKCKRSPLTKKGEQR